jgi:AMMECR1 domain-containing protein
MHVQYKQGVTSNLPHHHHHPYYLIAYKRAREPKMNNQIGSLFSTRLSTAYNQLRGDLGVPQTATDTIDKLVEKIQTSAAVEDRRTAVLGLKGLSRDWKEVRSAVRSQESS